MLVEVTTVGTVTPVAVYMVALLEPHEHKSMAQAALAKRSDFFINLKCKLDRVNVDFRCKFTKKG